MVKEIFYQHYSTIFEKELLDEIYAVSKFERMPEGTLMIDIDDELTHIPLILNGLVKIIRKDKFGDEIALYYLERGETCAISFVNCINKKRSIFKGVVEKELEALFLPVEYIDDWLRKYKSWRHFIIDSYHFRLIEMVDSIDGLAFLKLEQRIFKYLADKVKVTHNNLLEITHQEIADDLNSSRVVVSRLLKQLENEGKIGMRRNKIFIEQN